MRTTVAGLTTGDRRWNKTQSNRRPRLGPTIPTGNPPTPGETLVTAGHRIPPSGTSAASDGLVERGRQSIWRIGHGPERETTRRGWLS